MDPRLRAAELVGFRHLGPCLQQGQLAQWRWHHGVSHLQGSLRLFVAGIVSSPSLLSPTLADLGASASTLAALLLDIYVFKRSTRRGKYNQMMDVDTKRSGPGPQQSPWSTHVEDPDVEQRPYSDQRTKKSPGQTGYALPAEQFAYDDTGYHGVHSNGVNRF